MSVPVRHPLFASLCEQVVLGLSYNALIGTIPETLSVTLTTLASAFDAIALFTLGNSMVGLMSAWRAAARLRPKAATCGVHGQAHRAST